MLPLAPSGAKGYPLTSPHLVLSKSPGILTLGLSGYIPGCFSLVLGPGTQGHHILMGQKITFQALPRLIIKRVGDPNPVPESGVALIELGIVTPYTLTFHRNSKLSILN